jgi:hypothetical protein
MAQEYERRSEIGTECCCFGGGLAGPADDMQR